MQKNNNLKNKLLWFLFIAFLVITLWGLINHAPWRDEAQAWLIVRDLPFSGVIQQMSYEGTPPLWHLILFPLAKLGLPYESILVVHYLLALAIVFIFLFHSPLPKIIKILLPFNYYFLFEYSIVARNYNLTILFLFLIATLYKQRLKKPILYSLLITLLAWSNIHSLTIASLLLLLFFIDLIKEKDSLALKFSSFLLALVGIITSLITLIPKIDQTTITAFLGTINASKALAISLIPLLSADFIIINSASFYVLLGLIWLPLIFFLLKKLKFKIIFIINYLGLAYIFTFAHPGDLRHYGLILIVFIFLWWLDILENNNNFKIGDNVGTLSGLVLLITFLVISSIFSGYFYLSNKDKYFSGAKEMAGYLQANNLLQEEIAAYPSYSGSALLPYLPDKEFYQMETFEKGTFLTWNDTFILGKNSPYGFLKNKLKLYYQKKDGKPESILFLTIFPPSFDPELELISQTSKETVKKDEFFYLYRLPIN